MANQTPCEHCLIPSLAKCVFNWFFHRILDLIEFIFGVSCWVDARVNPILLPEILICLKMYGLVSDGSTGALLITSFWRAFFAFLSANSFPLMLTWPGIQQITIS